MSYLIANHYPSKKPEQIGKKKALLKKMVKDGKGGPGMYSSSDSAALSPYKNAYYKRVKAYKAFDRIAKLTGLGS